MKEGLKFDRKALGAALEAAEAARGDAPRRSTAEAAPTRPRDPNTSSSENLRGHRQTQEDLRMKQKMLEAHRGNEIKIDRIVVPLLELGGVTFDTTFTANGPYQVDDSGAVIAPNSGEESGLQQRSAQKDGIMEAQVAYAHAVLDADARYKEESRRYEEELAAIFEERRSKNE